MNQTSGVPRRFSSVTTGSSSFLTKATSCAMLARSRASEAIAPPVIPSVSMCVTIRTRGDARTRSAISWATASIGPSSGRQLLESLGEASEWRGHSNPRALPCYRYSTITISDYRISPSQRTHILDGPSSRCDPCHSDGPRPEGWAGAPGEADQHRPFCGHVGCLRRPPGAVRGSCERLGPRAPGGARDPSGPTAIPRNLRGHRSDLSRPLSALSLPGHTLGGRAPDRERRTLRDPLVHAGRSDGVERRPVVEGVDRQDAPDETLSGSPSFDRTVGRYGGRHRGPKDPRAHPDDCRGRLFEGSGEGCAPGPEIHADARIPDPPGEPDRHGDPRREGLSFPRYCAGSLRRSRHLPSFGRRSSDRRSGDQGSREGDLDGARDPAGRRGADSTRCRESR